MGIHAWIGVASAVVFASAYIPYIVSIVRKETRPHPVSWLLWGLIGAVTFWLSRKAGADETLPLVFLNFILPLVVAALSLRYWSGGLSRFDIACLFISLASLACYALTRNAALALSLNILADIGAYLPTLRKTWLDPRSESLGAWSLYLGGYVLGVLAIAEWSYSVAVFPVYLSVFGILMVSLILRGRLKKTEK